MSARRYVAAHESQYGADRSARTRSSGCTWTSAAIGVDAATGGRIDPEPDAVLRQVPRDQEENPKTPGWSLADVDRAMTRFGVGFAIRSGQGWRGVRAARAAGLAVLLQGDSDRFPGGCSGVFDGDHAILIQPDITHPTTRAWGINDPICDRLTYEPEATLRAYAEKFAPGVSFGVFTDPVPLVEEEQVDVYSVPGLFSMVWPAGTVTYDGPVGMEVRGTLPEARRLLVVGQSAASSPLRYLVEGIDPDGSDGSSGRMAWVNAAKGTQRRDESFNAGVTAGSKAALAARR